MNVRLAGQRGPVAGLTVLMMVAAAVGCGDDTVSVVDAAAVDGSTGGADASRADAAGSAADGAASGCPAGGQAQVTLAVQVPAGVMLTPMVRLTPAGGVPIALSSAAPTPVPSGRYVIEYRRVKVAPAPGGLVGTAFAPALVGAFDECLRAGEARTVTVAYTVEPGSQKLWASLVNAPMSNDAAAFGPTQLVTGEQVPSVLQRHATVQRRDLVIDPFGNLWVADVGKIVMFAMEKLGTSGTLVADRTVTGAAARNPQALAFDANGNLWIAQGGPTAAVEMLPAAVLTGATVTAAASVSFTASDLVDPKALAFDAAGNLWVASNSNNAIVMFAQARLSASSAAAPDKVLTAAQLNAPGGSVKNTHRGPQSLAWDAGGNLWVGYSVSSEIVRFTPTELAAAGARRVDNPLVKTFGGASLKGLAFDEAGGLWFSLNSASGVIGRLPVAELAMTGAATPDVSITSAAVSTAERVLFNPAPAGLPLND